jgi:hypothetical protein
VTKLVETAQQGRRSIRAEHLGQLGGARVAGEEDEQLVSGARLDDVKEMRLLIFMKAMLRSVCFQVPHVQIDMKLST